MTRRLPPTQAKILQMLQCIDPCPTVDLLNAAGIASDKSLRVHICGLRKHGYRIENIRGYAPLRESAYSLVQP